jgi:hypothetical protein
MDSSHARSPDCIETIVLHGGWDKRHLGLHRKQGERHPVRLIGWLYRLWQFFDVSGSIRRRCQASLTARLAMHRPPPRASRGTTVHQVAGRTRVRVPGSQHRVGEWRPDQIDA